MADQGSPPASLPPRRTERLVPWVVGVAVLLVWLMLIDSLPVGVMRDDGLYVILAKSLATGQGYRWIHLPNAPTATHFPPGFPVLLAALWKVVPDFPRNVALFKGMNALLVAAAAASLTLFAHRRLGFGARAAGAIAIAAALAVPTLTMGTVVMSEPLFLALIVPALLLAEQLADAPAARWKMIGLGALAGAAMLVRSQGIVLPLALVVVLAIRRRPRDAVLSAAACGLVTLPWHLWMRAHRSAVPEAMGGMYESYGQWLVRGWREGGVGVVARTVERNAGELLAMLSMFAGGPSGELVRHALIVIGIVLIAFGARALWAHAPVTGVFLVLYFVIVIVWPFGPPRFVYGLWPLIFVVPVLGARAAWRWRAVRPSYQALRGMLLVGSAAVAIGFAVYNMRGYRGRRWSSIPRHQIADADPVLRWVAGNTAPNEVIASQFETLVYLYTGRLSVPTIGLTVGEYLTPPSVAERAHALHEILGAYRANAVIVADADPLRAAAEMMASGAAPDLVRRGRFDAGVVFAPVGR